jgi:hypothetical protein
MSLLPVKDGVSGIQDANIRTSSLVPTGEASVEIEILKDKQGLKSSSTRRSPRLRLQVPVFVRGTDVSGAQFVELTKTVNISANGACIACVHVLRPEQIIHLTIPAPSPSSPSLVPSETPPIRAKVLRYTAIGDMRLFGLDFLRPLE